MKRKKPKAQPPHLFPNNDPAQPKHLIKDRAKVVVDVDQADRGTVERHQKGEAIDSTGTVEAGIIGAPVQTVTVDHGISRPVMRANRTLDILLRNNTINKEQFDAGRAFEDVFLWSQRDIYNTVKYDEVSKSMSPRDYLDIQLDNKRKLQELIAQLGGDCSAGTIAMINIVGKQYSFSHLKSFAFKTEQFWRGALLTALDILVNLRRGRAVRKNDKK